MSAPPIQQSASLALQRIAGRCTVALWAPMAVAALRWVMGYRFHDLRAGRRRFRALLEKTAAPILVCPNHLTMIDSAIIAWGLASPWRYVVSYRLLPWNTPERKNFAHPLIQVFCYFAKCLPIVRGGSRAEQHMVLSKCAALLERGEVVMIFPEGRRSRTGRVDREALADGVGRLVKSVPGCQVLCVYLRGDAQERYSTVPQRGERFSMQFNVIHPRASSRGVRGSRQIATQIVRELARLEDAHFEKTAAHRNPPIRKGEFPTSPAGIVGATENLTAGELYLGRLLAAQDRGANAQLDGLRNNP